MTIAERINKLSIRQRETLWSRLSTDSADSPLQLVAYVTARHGRAIKPDALRTYLRERLPEFMVPPAIVELASLPLNANGKVDRAALPDPKSTATASPAPAAPESEAQETIAAIWEEVLHISGPGIHDNFFRLGGHSLAALQVLARIRSAFSVELPLRAIFKAPTIATLAEAVARAPRARAIEPIHRELVRAAAHAPVNGQIENPLSKRS